MKALRRLAFAFPLFVTAAAVSCGSDEPDASGDTPDADVVDPSDGDAAVDAKPADPTPDAGTDAAEAGAPGWSDPVLLEKATGTVSAASVAISDNGDAVVVFAQEGAPERRDIWASRYAKSTGAWSEPVLIETGSGTTSSPQVVMDAAGDAMAVWTQDDGGVRLAFANRLTNGVWGTPVKLSTADPGRIGGMSLAMSASGIAIVAFAQYDNSRFNIWGARHDKTSWSTPQRLETDDTNADPPVVAINASGNGFAVWRHTSADQRTKASRYATPGGWGMEAPISTASVTQYPRLAINDAGDAIAIWQTAVGREMEVSRFVAASGGWTDPVSIGTGYPVAPSHARVAMDPQGNVFAVWPVNPSDGAPQNLAFRRLAGGTWSPLEWLGRPGVRATGPSIHADENGNAMALWLEELPPHVSLWNRRYVAGAGWDEPALVHEEEGAPVSGYSSAMNKKGEAVVVWRQSNGGGDDLWAKVHPAPAP